MKRYKVIEVIRLLNRDNWSLDYWKGDHRQFRHPVKRGKVTVRGKHSDTFSPENLNSIWKQAGWKETPLP
jgi:predicted RNA binding protein YcfA (HicA-like mRNA interferase family)